MVRLAAFALEEIAGAPVGPRDGRNIFNIDNGRKSRLSDNDDLVTISSKINWDGVTLLQ